MQNKLNLIMRGGRVKRYHVMDTLKQQTVAEHSFGVAWLVWLLCDGRPSVELVMAALQHDLAEHVTGDLPAPAKRSLGISKQFEEYESAIMADARMPQVMLTQAERRTLKFADTCDLMLYCLREMELGNYGIHEVYKRGRQYICELGERSTKESELYNYIQGVERELVSKH